MKHVWYMSDDEFEKAFPRDREKWTEKEEREVLETLRNMNPDPEKRSESIWSIIRRLSRIVGRTPGSLRSRFGAPRLKIEWLFGLLDRERYIIFMRNVLPHSNYAKRREMKKQLIKRDEIFGEKTEPAEIKDRLRGQEDKWKISYDPYRLLIDKDLEKSSPPWEED